MKDWEQVCEKRRKRNFGWLRAGLVLALLAWCTYFVILPLLRHP